MAQDATAEGSLRVARAAHEHFHNFGGNNGGNNNGGNNGGNNNGGNNNGGNMGATGGNMGNTGGHMGNHGSNMGNTGGNMGATGGNMGASTGGTPATGYNPAVKPQVTTTNNQYQGQAMNNQYQGQATGTMNYNGGQQNSNYGGQAMANNGYNGGQTSNNGGYGNNNGYVQTYNADTCFHCDAPTLEECQRRGMVKPCRGGTNNVCMIEYRMRDGKTFGVCMGCKEQSVCLNQRAQNFGAAGGYRGHSNNQCRPGYNAEVSVCRNCCKGQNCWGTNTYNFVLNGQSTIEDWLADRGLGRDTSMDKKTTMTTYGGSSN